MSDEFFSRMENERRICLQNILESDSPYKIIVAGPGTGKTYTFGELLEHDPGESLVITLINNLVDKMQEDMGDLADVRTFHSFSRQILHNHPFGGITPAFHFYPALDQIISYDSSIVHNAGLIGNQYSEDDFGISFRLLNEDNESIGFFLELSDYYDAVGFDDSVYRIYQLFNSSKESIPEYHHVMVDEYQDFNNLEVQILSKLESKNRVLIVGDDDQSIYQFRQASPDHLRRKVNDPKYVRFPLPYSTRCTSAVISAVDNVISEAQTLGLLNDRLDKDFRCYLPDKQTDNENYPCLQKVSCSVHRSNAPYISRYIENIVSDIPETEVSLANQKNYCLALVVGEAHYLRSIYDYLSERFNNVRYKPSSDIQLSILDGYKLLLERENSNLGWRILLEYFHPAKLDEYIIEYYKNRVPLIDLIDEDFANLQYGMLEILRKLKVDQSLLTPDDLSRLVDVIGIPIDGIVTSFVETNNENNQSHENDDNDSEPSILLSTFNGCKGLSAGYTFITGFDTDTFPDNRTPTPTEVCQFIVSMTRTRKQCHLIHTNNFVGTWHDPSVFFGWIPDQISETITVDKDYF